MRIYEVTSVYGEIGGPGECGAPPARGISGRGVSVRSVLQEGCVSSLFTLSWMTITLAWFSHIGSISK